MEYMLLLYNKLLKIKNKKYNLHIIRLIRE